MRFDSMSFLLATNTESTLCSSANKSKSKKGRSFNSMFASKPRSKSTKSTPQEHITPINFLAVPYTTVNSAGLPYIDIPAPNIHSSTSSSGSASTSTIATTVSGPDGQSAVPAGKSKPASQLNGILVSPHRAKSAPGKANGRRKKSVRFVPEPVYVGPPTTTGANQYSPFYSTSSSANLATSSSHSDTNATGGLQEYHGPFLTSRNEHDRPFVHQTVKVKPASFPITPADELETTEFYDLFSISPLATPTPISVRTPLKRSNVYYDSRHFHSRHSLYMDAAQAASLALCEKIRNARAGEVAAKKGVEGGSGDVDTGMSMDSGVGVEGYKGWGRMG